MILCPIGLTCCEVMISKPQFRHTFIICKKMQQLHHVGCDWTNDRQMFLHQGTDIHINSIHLAVNTTNLKTIHNIQICTHCIAAKIIKLTGQCIASTPYILDVEINELISMQNTQLVMISTVHLKEEVEPAQVPLTLKMFSDDMLQVDKHTIMGTLWLYVNDQ